MSGASWIGTGLAAAVHMTQIDHDPQLQKMIQVDHDPQLPNGQYAGKVSKLEFNIPGFKIIVQVVGPHSMRTRRRMLLILYRSLKNDFRVLRRAEIHHYGARCVNYNNELTRVIGFRNSPNLDTAAGRFGFAVQMHRLKLGLSQEQLSARSGLSRPHLSKIEKGKTIPRGSTLQKLQEALDADLTSAKFNSFLERDRKRFVENDPPHRLFGRR